MYSGEVMGASPGNCQLAVRALLLLYASIIAIAAAFEVFTDRSFGALVISSLPVSVLAAIGLLFGPWIPSCRRGLFAVWMIGAVLVIVLTQAFAAQGTEQAKVAETILTYAGTVTVFPSSLIAVIALSSEPALRLLPGDISLRMLVQWIVLFVLGLSQWATCMALGLAMRLHSHDEQHG